MRGLKIWSLKLNSTHLFRLFFSTPTRIFENFRAFRNVRILQRWSENIEKMRFSEFSLTLNLRSAVPYCTTCFQVSFRATRVSCRGSRVSFPVSFCENHVSFSGKHLSFSGKLVSFCENHVSFSGKHLSFSGNRVSFREDRISFSGKHARGPNELSLSEHVCSGPGPRVGALRLFCYNFDSHNLCAVSKICIPKFWFSKFCRRVTYQKRGRVPMSRKINETDPPTPIKILEAICFANFLLSSKK